MVADCLSEQAACAECVVPGSQQPLAGQLSGVDVHQNNVRNVLSALEYCKHETMFSSLGFEIAQLGDDASASILKGFDRTELAKRENIKGYLCIVRLAFWKPERIARAEDRVPGVTIFLLEYLKEKTAHEKDLEAQINSVEAYVKQQTQEQPRTSQDSLTPDGRDSRHGVHPGQQ